MPFFLQTIIKALELGMNVVVEPKMFTLIIAQLDTASECMELPQRVVEGFCSTMSTSNDALPEAQHCAAQLMNADEFLANTPPMQPMRRCSTSVTPLNKGSRSLPTALSQQDFTRTFEADASNMVTERGRLGAKTSAMEEAQEMVHALLDSIQDHYGDLCNALEADVAAAEASMALQAYLTQVLWASRLHWQDHLLTLLHSCCRHKFKNRFTPVWGHGQTHAERSNFYSPA
jgi:hypothetical protein